MPIPGEALARRPLHFIWLLDTSGSMNEDGKIQALNVAIQEAIPHIRDVALDNPNAEILMRAVAFSNGARWVISQPTPVEQFQWTALTAEGLTDMGRAFALIAEQLRVPPMSRRALPPVLVLLSDGDATDDWERGLNALFQEPWGQKAARLAIAIGRDCKHDVLQRFIRHAEIKVMQANNPEALTKFIRFVSTEVVKSASAPASQALSASISTNVPMPAPPDVSGDDVW